jgi:nucleoid-associated protein YgaU
MGIFDPKKEKEKPKPDFSNVQSGGSSTAPASKPTPAQPEGDTSVSGRTYVVERGDSLWKIAKRHYGDGEKWRKIYEANRDQIKDPDLIHPGQKLRIPN